MTTYARARTGEPIDIDRLASLWNDSPPGWTDMLLAWSTGKTVGSAIDQDTVDESHTDVIRQALARMPYSPDLAATLTRATANATRRTAPRP